MAMLPVNPPWRRAMAHCAPAWPPPTITTFFLFMAGWFGAKNAQVNRQLT
jgi:hypothetical protein